MAYVAARGGERAIDQSERLFREDVGVVDAARVAQIKRALPYLVDRLMGEASLYEEDLAALALAQAGGDLYEATLLLRAWRTTRPRIGVAAPVRTEDLFTHRRISAAFKDIPGGQVLGPSLDYAHKTLDEGALDGAGAPARPVEPAAATAPAYYPSVADWQRAAGLADSVERIEVAPEDIPDVTREPALFPALRAQTMQSLARADTGGVLALGYSAMRGYGSEHPTVNELRLAEAEVVMPHPAGPSFSIGRVRVSQAEVVSTSKSTMLKFGFCATLGWNEVKCIAGATLDLNAGTAPKGSAIEEEFVLYHTEGVEASGFCLHFKLPHYVTFQSDLDAMRQARAGEAGESRSEAAEKASESPADAEDPA